MRGVEDTIFLNGANLFCLMGSMKASDTEVLRNCDR